VIWTFTESQSGKDRLDCHFSYIRLVTSSLQICTPLPPHPPPFTHSPSSPLPPNLVPLHAIWHHCNTSFVYNTLSPGYVSCGGRTSRSAIWQTRSTCSKPWQKAISKTQLS
jgi:hypothetical protein